MDCNTARMLITFFGRQGSELAPEDAAALEAHLGGCPGCAAAVRFERAFDDRVARAMLAVPVPEGLKGKLLDGVAADRGAWYRQKFYALAGLAASLLLGIGGVVAWQIRAARPLTQADIVAQAEAEFDNRDRMVQDVLGPRGLHFNPERPFNVRAHLVKAGVGPFQGKEVPFLYFHNRAQNAEATVYVVRDTDFDWRSLPQDGSSVVSKYMYQVAVLRDLKDDGVGYVVVFTGAGLEVFLEERSSL